MSNRLKVTPNDLSAFWMPFTATGSSSRRRACSCRAKDMHYTTQRRPQGARRHGRPVVRQCRPLPPEDHRGDPAAGGRARLRAGLPDGPPDRLRIRQPAGRHRARRAGPCVLHQFRFGIGRHGAEDRARLSPREGQRLALPADRPRARLSRRQFRRHLGRRHRHQPQDVRHAADRRRPHAAHASAGQERLHARRAGAWRGARRRARAHRHAARRLDHRRRHRRAGRRLDRRADPAEGLSAEAARDLRQARHPADLRRGHHRLRPPRHAVRRRLFRRHARHHDHGQGRHQRRHPDGRGVREERDPRRLHERARAPDRVLPRLHLFGQPDRLRGRPRHARHLQGRGPADARRRTRLAFRGRAAFAEGRAARHRHPQHRPGRRDRTASRSPAARPSGRSRPSSRRSSAAR